MGVSGVTGCNVSRFFFEKQAPIPFSILESCEGGRWRGPTITNVRDHSDTWLCSGLSVLLPLLSCRDLLGAWPLAGAWPQGRRAREAGVMATSMLGSVPGPRPFGLASLFGRRPPRDAWEPVRRLPGPSAARRSVAAASGPALPGSHLYCLELLR